MSFSAIDLACVAVQKARPEDVPALLHLVAEIQNKLVEMKQKTNEEKDKQNKKEDELLTLIERYETWKRGGSKDREYLDFWEMKWTKRSPLHGICSVCCREPLDGLYYGTYNDFICRVQIILCIECRQAYTGIDCATQTLINFFL